MILNEITEKLQQIDNKVFYGAVDTNAVKNMAWNYTVFNRQVTSISANKTGFTDKYIVNVVRENFVPEGLDKQVIDKMLEIDGVRVSGADIQYTYLMKPNTNTVIEMLTIEFIKARKG